MDPILIGALGIGGLVVLAAVGVPIGIAISVVAAAGMWQFVGFDYMMVTFKTLPFAVASQYVFVVIPMFVLMGTLASSSGMITELYTAANRWVGGLRGGLYMATTLASAGFSAISGSTVVNAAMFTRIALPEMIRFGYDRGVAAGCIAAAGTLAALIPPSLSFVIYGLLTEESIGALFMAGIVPGLLTAVFYIMGIALLLRFRPGLAPPTEIRYGLQEKFRSLTGLWPLIILVALVLGGIYSGFMPPSAAGAVGAMGALGIAVVRRKLSPTGLWTALQGTAAMTSVLFLIVIGGLLFTRFLLVSGFVTDLTEIVSASGLSPMQFVAVLVVMYFFLGMFIDPMSMLVMTVPFVYPVVKSLGLDPIWFGVIVVKLIEIAVITPPVGMNLFAVMSASGGEVAAGRIFRGILPFVIIEMFVLIVLIAFPALSTWLPTKMLH